MADAAGWMNHVSLPYQLLIYLDLFQNVLLPTYLSTGGIYGYSHSKCSLANRPVMAQLYLTAARARHADSVERAGSLDLAHP